MFQRNKKWEKGKVLDNCNNRSYIVQDLYGNTYRRNRKFITKTTIPFATNDIASNFYFIVYDDLLVSTLNEVENPNEEFRFTLTMT